MINPKEIKGNWDKGYVLDKHTVKSECIGEDIYGHPQFVTERTKLGELVFQLKYRNNLKAADDILDLIKEFLDNWKELEDVDIILPVPSSKQRVWQPVNEISRKISDYLEIPMTDKVLIKTNSEQAKNMDLDKKNVENSIVALKKAKKSHNILLVDDLFQTGTTLEECVKVLKEDNYLKKIFVLVMTKTR